MMPAVASAAAPARSTTTTLAPCRAKPAAAARPMPLPPPVISATLPVKSILLPPVVVCSSPSAGHVQGRAGDVARLVGGKIENGVGDLARLSDAAHRRQLVGAEVAVAHLLEHRCRALGGDRSGATALIRMPCSASSNAASRMKPWMPALAAE